MSKARLVLTALLVDRQTPAEVAARYGVHRSWADKLKARYDADGDAAFEPRSRRPKTRPTAVPPATVALITSLREQLTTAGLDAGPDTIAWHLAHHHAHHRVGVHRQPLPGPRRAGHPNAEEAAHVVLPPVRGHPAQRDLAGRLPPTTGSPTPTARPAPTPRSSTWLDDHSRYAVSVTAHAPVTGPVVLAAFRGAIARHGTPASTLTDIQTRCALDCGSSGR